MKNYIIGCGGFAKDVYCILKRNKINFNGFIGIEKTIIKTQEEEHTSILEQEILSFNNLDVNFYIGVGSPSILYKIKEKYSKFNFPNLIDPDSKVLGKINLGNGNIICSNTIFTTDITIGSFNIFNFGCTIGHDASIGDCNVFNPSCCISGNVKIINNNLFGVNSTILEGVSISSNNIVGGSALVTKNIQEMGIYIGVPAKRKL